MFRRAVVPVLFAMMLALPVLGQPEGEQPADGTVTMTAEQWPAAQVAAELEKQTGARVAVTEWTEGSVTGTLEDFTLEEAVTSLGQAAKVSWVRFYMLETTPPDEPYSASELILKLDEARDAWLESLTEEERAELFGMRRGGDDGGRRGPPDQAQGDQGEAADEQAAAPAEGEAADEPDDGNQGDDQGQGNQDRGQRGQRGQRGFGMNFEGPGGAIAQPPAPQGGEEGGGDRFGGRGDYDDPIRGLLLPGRTDSITLDVTDAPLQDALSAFMLASHFIVVTDEDLTGGVSMQLEDAPLSAALDAMAEASGTQWRTVYLVSAPRKFTPEEIAQRELEREERREQRFNERWAEFWGQPKEERTESIQRRVGWMERMADRIQNPDEDDDPERTQRRRERMARRMTRMMDRMMNYSTQLTPEQRLEIKPLLQAMAKLNAMQ